jgi:Acyclic terpene utilisation family protein AtuA
MTPQPLSMRSIRIGSGAGYSGDRIDPAAELATRGSIAYLVFECLAERTIALAQQRKQLNPDEGYDPLLSERMEAVLPICHKQGIKIISNMGAANPLAAASRVKSIAQRLGIRGLRIAAVTGDDVLTTILHRNPSVEETSDTVSSLSDNLISANAYLGMEPLVQALADRADVVITGRVADPSLFLAPLVHEFGWHSDDWQRLGQGTVVGHLLECAGQVTGGYFADPGFKDVPNLARLGFPLAEVYEDGSALITKVEGSGGRITRATCIEQLLYEIQDPADYPTPDVIANFSQVTLEEVGRDIVRVAGGTGRARPSSLKVSLGCRDGFLGEAQISYAGLGALERAKLSNEIISERLRETDFSELRFDFIGLNSIHGEQLSNPACEPYEVRLRVAGKAMTSRIASLVPREVEALYTNGPAGGGGVSSSMREVIAILSTFIPREGIKHEVHFEVS